MLGGDYLKGKLVKKKKRKPVRKEDIGYMKFTKAVLGKYAYVN